MPGLVTGSRLPDAFAARVRGARGGVALAARGALLRDARGARIEAGGGVPPAHAVPARPRPDRPLEELPPPQVQDAGLHRPEGRPLPHAAHAHARGGGNLARRRARAPAERGSRPRRSRSATTSATPPFGHTGEEALDEALAERFGRHFRHNEQSLRVVEVLERDGRGLNLTAEVRDGILNHTGPGTPRDPRGKDRAARRPRRVHQPRHRRRASGPASSRPRICRARRSRCSAHAASRRIDTLVHDLVEASADAGDIVQSDEIGRGDAEPAGLHVRARVPRPATEAERASRDHDRRPHLRAPRRPPGRAARPTGPETFRSAITDYVAGMTDRFALAWR